MSQFPPCSRGGIVRQASFATRSNSAPLREPKIASVGLGSKAKGGTRSGSVATNSASRLFQVASNSWEGAQPINPGWGIPANLTSGM